MSSFLIPCPGEEKNCDNEKCDKTENGTYHKSRTIFSSPTHVRTSRDSLKDANARPSPNGSLLASFEVPGTKNVKLSNYVCLILMINS